MKYIKKKSSPDSLEAYKKTENASFKRLPSKIKKELKLQLIDEQGGLCCYCGDRITYESSNIEHFKPKDPKLFPELQLEYSNLLSSCLGGQIERQTSNSFPLSCDARKKNKVIDLSPTDPSCEDQFTYDIDGSIFGITEQAKKVIVDLNLNNEVQKNRRKAAIDPYVVLDMKTVSDCNAEITFLSSRNKKGLFQPYCFAAIYYIKHYVLPFAV